MNSDGDYIEEFRCVISRETHYLIEPILLTCKHSSCKSCFEEAQKANEDGYVYCFACKMLGLRSDENEDCLLNAKKAKIETRFDELFASIEKNISKTLLQFKGKKLIKTI